MILFTAAGNGEAVAGTRAFGNSAAETAIEVMLDKIKKNPPNFPARPAYPIK
jgi:hypothetical protein